MRATAIAVRCHRSPWWTWAILLGLLAMVKPAFGAGAIRDDAGFFSQSAIDSAKTTIGDIESRYHKDVVIETFAAIPADKASAYDPAQKDQFFAKWARERFGEDRANGIYVLICKDPPFLKTEIGRDTIKRDFSQANGRELSAKMLAKFKAKQFDAGLSDGLDYISSTLAQTMGSQENPQRSAAPSATPSFPPRGQPSNNNAVPMPPRSGGGINLAGIVMGIVILMIVFAIIRRVLRGSRSYGQSGPGVGGPGYQQPGPGYYGGGSGGGFGRGLLGGLLGGAAGGYLYDRMAHRDESGSSGNAFPPSQPGGLSDNDQGIASNQDTGGGSFGDSGGGGGDSSGGGDFGGGGGGGDSSGGGSF